MTDRVRTAPSFDPGTDVIVTDYFGVEFRAVVRPHPTAGMVRIRRVGSTFDDLADVRKVREA